MLRLLAFQFLLVAFTLPLLASDGIPSSSSSFDRKLAAPVTARWNNVTFRQAVDGLKDAQDIAIVIDRRVDGEAPFALSVAGDSLQLSLARIAEQKQIGCSIFWPVVYFGPESTCQRLQTVAELRREAIAKLPAQVRRRMLQSRPGGWSMLAEPAKLVEQLAAEAEVRVENLTAIPHDLWAESRLPPMPWSDRLTVILAQFDLTFDVDGRGKSITLMPIPKKVAIVKKYAGGSTPRDRLAQLKKLVPDAQIVVQEGQLLVRGRLEDHREIESLLAGKPVRTQAVQRGEQRYQLKVNGLPLEKVFAQLGKMLNLEIAYDHAAIANADISLQQLISFEVADVTLDELITAALKDTGLNYKLSGKTITIGLAE